MKILVHTCCAPCAFEVINHLKKEGYLVDLLFYNPNIHPLLEFNKRLEGVELLANIHGVNLIVDRTDKMTEWVEAGTKRCSLCYEDRIQALFRYAKKYNYDVVSTTLLTSKYQNHDLVRDLLIKYSNIYNINYYYYDFREYYYISKIKCKEYDIYSQKYCGCIISSR